MKRSLAFLAVLCLALTGCGTRRSHQELLSAHRGSDGTARDASSTQAEAASSGSGSTANENLGVVAGDAGGTSSASGSGNGSGAAAGASGGGSGRAPAGAPGARVGIVVGTKSSIRIATVGTVSGPAGASLKPQSDGVRVWVRWINDRGGVNGHPVEHLVADDGGDPSRHRALKQELVEQRKVIAFVGNPEALTGAGSVEYMTKAGVPVVGSEGAGQWFYESPVYFPQGATGNALAQAGAYQASVINKPKGITKVGLINCVEVQICRDATNRAPAMFRKHGMEVVYNASASLAQPDFTAECLNARNAGAQIISLGMDANAIRTVAQACARQGYRPIFGWTAGSAVAAHAQDPNLDGAQIASFVQGWPVRNTPGTREFHDAMTRYAPGVAVAGGHMLGWVAAKVFEAGTKSLPEPATARAALEGLWSLRGDVLPDLTGPLLFSPGKPATPSVCNYAVTIKNGKFESANNGQRSCTTYDAKL